MIKFFRLFLIIKANKRIKLDELKWRNIVNESNAKKSNIRVDLENLKNRFFFINYDEIESRVKFFEQIDITSKFKYTGYIEFKNK